MTPTPIFKIFKNRHEITIRQPRLARWDDFRTLEWIYLIDEPEKLMDDVRTSFVVIY